MWPCIWCAGSVHVIQPLIEEVAGVVTRANGGGGGYGHACVCATASSGLVLWEIHAQDGASGGNKVASSYVTSYKLHMYKDYAIHIDI
jgi:hypothetical protein